MRKLFDLSMVTKFLLWSGLLFVLVIFTGVRAIWNNQNAETPDYVYWQNQYTHIASELTTDPAVKEATLALQPGVKQATVLQFNLLRTDGSTQQRVDRCESCHTGLTNPQMTAENIIKVLDKVDVPTDQLGAYLDDPKHAATLSAVKTLGAHPGIDIEGVPGGDKDLGVIHSAKLTYGAATNSSVTEEDKADYQLQKQNLKQHPFPTFGCTTCHYGSGRELIQDKAHGDPEHWLSPLLPAKYMQAACAQCHASYNDKTFKIDYTDPRGVALPGMATIARGEQLFTQYACYGCHKIDGLSKGNVGPELTYEGRTKLPVAIAHQLWDPRYMVDACVMPYFFSVRAHNTDLPSTGVIGSPQAGIEMVDPRVKNAQSAVIEDEDTKDSLKKHGYLADQSKEADLDALVTFIASQTGQNYAQSQSSRFTTIAAYNTTTPLEVTPTVAEGKRLFEASGCYACHYVGNPNKAHITGDTRFGKGGVVAPELSWEGTRHSQQWMIAHYQNPQAFVPGSIMPIFPFSNSQRAALALYDSSLKPAKVGARPVSPDQDLAGGRYDTKAAQPLVNPANRFMTR